MVYINSKLLRYFTLGLMVCVLAACVGAPTKTPVPEDQDTGAVEETETPLILIPNPYLAKAPAVSKEAKEEFAKALAAMTAKQWSQAEGMLTVMAETWPTLSGPLVNLGIAQYQQQKLEKAEASLKAAIAVNKTNMDAYTWLGVIYREQGRFNEAETLYKAALSVWPHHADSLRNLGILYDLYMGRFEEALSQYQLLQRVLPEESRQIKGWIRDLERRIAENSSA